MQTFTDARGRTWSLSLTGAKLTKLREALGYSPAIVATPDGVAKWRGLECTRDPDQFLEVLRIILGDQIANGGKWDDFLETFDGPTYQRAEVAYRNAFYAFSPIPDALKQAFEGATGTEAESGTSPSKNGPTNSPGPPASTPARIPSEF